MFELEVSRHSLLLSWTLKHPFIPFTEHSRSPAQHSLDHHGKEQKTSNQLNFIGLIKCPTINTGEINCDYIQCMYASYLNSAPRCLRLTGVSA
ncbi:hypothetical protein [Serratia marcescens]|uniref:hypothetical protein n=1 Tax=Serratia marcescens TaxID=615 RepID=UPI0011B80F90|nr:hypothetical protein [Serratia marcescens]